MRLDDAMMARCSLLMQSVWIIAARLACATCDSHVGHVISLGRGANGS
jgi:peptide methionine sulfoxide reductase MsrB